MAKRQLAEEELELDDDRDEQVEDEDDGVVDPDEIKVSKKRKTVVKSDDSDDEQDAEESEKKIAAGKKKLVKSVRSADVETADEEDEERQSKKSGKKGGKVVMIAPEKKHRSTSRNGDVPKTPYGDKALIGKAFNLALKGVPVKKLKQLAEDNKKGKTPAYWILTDLRNGKWETSAGKWTWDAEEEDGYLKIKNVRLKQSA